MLINRYVYLVCLFLSFGLLGITPYRLGADQAQADQVQVGQVQAVKVQALSQQELIAGWLENAWLSDYQIHLKSKLDTGADVSSINAPDYELYELAGKRWVRFSVRNSIGKSVDISKPIVRYATIVRAGAKKSRRPVIELILCIGGYHKTTELNLADRSGLDYQLLIGRKFLGSNILVHSEKTYLHSDRCIEN